MSESDVECLECSAQYAELAARYRKLKKKIRKMRKSFAAVECALLNKCDHYAEFIIGECEAHRGKYVADQIAADEYLEKKKVMRGRGTGLKITPMRHSGA